VPEEWDVAPLGELASVERGKFGHRPRNDPRFYGGKHPFIQTGDVTACDGIIKTYTQTLNDEGLKVSRLFASGTIVITIAANIGETGIASFDVAFPDSLVGIQCGDKVDARFLELVLRTRKSVLDKAATESAQKNINLQTLRPLPIQLPELSEQKEIAEVIWASITRVEQERLMRDQLVQLKGALMSVLLTGEVRVKPNPEPS